jgi:hypothetical protein
VTWRRRLGIGPVTLRARHVKDPFLGLVLGGLGFEDDGTVGVEELVGDVGEDGGAARGDAAFGDESEEAGEELADVRAGGELGKFGEKVGGEVFRVGLGLNRKGNGAVRLGVAEAKARVSWQAGKAAALAVGIKIRTARGSGFRRDCDRIVDEAGANGCGVHEFFLFWWRGGYIPPIPCMNLKTKGLQNGFHVSA